MFSYTIHNQDFRDCMLARAGHRRGRRRKPQRQQKAESFRIPPPFRRHREIDLMCLVPWFSSVCASSEGPRLPQSVGRLETMALALNAAADSIAARRSQVGTPRQGRSCQGMRVGRARKKLMRLG